MRSKVGLTIISGISRGIHWQRSYENMNASEAVARFFGDMIPAERDGFDSIHAVWLRAGIPKPEPGK